jgi:GMP synthase (glutamine-hydrolysing)
MPKILVFQHVAHQILGTLDPLLREAGFRIRYVNFGRDPAARPDLDGYDGLVVLGGPMSADQSDRHPHLDHEVDVIRDALDRDRPVLGICLGAQLLARALDARVAPAPTREIGWYDVAMSEAAREDALVGHFDAVERLFQWHGDTFELPSEAVHLASSELCPNQAFRAGTRAYGFQFHLEVDTPMIERWLAAPENREHLGGGDGAADPADIRAETARQIARQREIGERAFTGFVRLLRPEPRPRILRLR